MSLAPSKRGGKATESAVHQLVDGLRYVPDSEAEHCDAEVVDVTPTPNDISRRTDSRHYKLEVTAGKDTTSQSGGKQRDTWLPINLEAQINRYVQNTDNEIGPTDSIAQRSKRTVQTWIDRAADAAADDTGDQDYRRISSHDLRRCWAHHLLVEGRISPRIVMALAVGAVTTQSSPTSKRRQKRTSSSR